MSDIAVKVSQPIALRARLNEDWLAVVIGLLVFGVALISISGTDLLGWAVTTSVYTDLAQALNPFAKAYAWLGGGGALLATYAALLVVLSAGVVTLGGDARKFALAFTAVFAIAYASWIIGSYAYVAAVTPAEQQKFGLSWSLKLTNEGGFIGTNSTAQRRSGNFRSGMRDGWERISFIRRSRRCSTCLSRSGPWSVRTCCGPCWMWGYCW